MNIRSVYFYCSKCVIINRRLYIYSKIDKVESNIDIYSMVDMYSKGADHIIDKWPGTKSGSIKNEEIRPYLCDEDESHCRNISGTFSVNIKKWRNKTFHFNSSYTYDSLYKNTVPLMRHVLLVRNLVEFLTQ